MLADQFPQNTQFKIICRKCPESCKLNNPVNEKLSAQELLTAWAGHFEAALKSFCAYTLFDVEPVWPIIANVHSEGSGCPNGYTAGAFELVIAIRVFQASARFDYISME
jgi:CxxC motif-containing protein